MSRFHDDSTHATNPGCLELSEAKLRRLEPELFGNGTFVCSATCAKLHPAAEIRERIDEQLKIGDASPALVLSLDPLLVGAYAGDLDGVILLRFPRKLATEYGLAVGSRLIAVSSFNKMTMSKSGELAYACDILPGPQRVDWSNFQPYIGDFLSDDAQGIEARKAVLDESVWQRAKELGELRLRVLGARTARDGKPSKAGIPVAIGNGGLFRPIHRLGKSSGMPRSLAWAILIAMAIGAIWIQLAKK